MSVAHASGSVLPEGYRFAGVHSGLRASEPGRLDLALVVSDRPAAATGVFTQNCVAAAPVHLCRERLPRADARGFVVCSGNANACTGEQGLADARRMAARRPARLIPPRPSLFHLRASHSLAPRTPHAPAQGLSVRRRPLRAAGQ